MRWPLMIVLLLAGAFATAASLDSWYAGWSGKRANAINVLLGDSRKLLANHVISKADSYYHSGYYPTIFDRAIQAGQKSHLEEAAQHSPAEEEECEHGEGESCAHESHEDADFLGESRDWIDGFGRSFFPSVHQHVEEANEREVLPWLRLAAELDPQKVETYVVGSYTLAKRLKKPAEGEQFLWEGLRQNPDSYEIVFELGRLQYEHHHNPDAARKFWELAVKKWDEQAEKGRKPDEFPLAQILGMLAKVEEESGNYAAAITYLERLVEISPYKDSLLLQIADLRAKQQQSGAPR